MLGAAHATANPLTASYDVVHGRAVLTMLPTVMRWNAQVVGEVYDSLRPDLIEWVEGLREISELAPVAAPEEDLPGLARSAALQWTGQFNPRPLEVADFQAIYSEALERSIPVPVPESRS